MNKLTLPDNFINDLKGVDLSGVDLIATETAFITQAKMLIKSTLGMSVDIFFGFSDMMEFNLIIPNKQMELDILEVLYSINPVIYLSEKE